MERARCAVRSCTSLWKNSSRASSDRPGTMRRRARLSCSSQLESSVRDERDEGGPDALEMAETALRTLALPELAPFLGQLVPEIPLWAANPPHYLAGRADAAAIEGERIALVIDWKSDVNPTTAAHSAHAAQLRDYISVTNAQAGRYRLHDHERKCPGSNLPSALTKADCSIGVGVQTKHPARAARSSRRRDCAR